MLKNMPPFWRHRLKSYALSLLATIGVMLLLIGIGSAVLTRVPLIATWERQNLPFLQYLFILIAAIAVVWYSYRLWKRLHAISWNNRGVRLARQRRLDEALAAYDRALKFTPKYATPWLNKGVAHSWLKHYDKALADLHHAQELEPTQPLVWNNIASVLCEDLHRYGEALAVCDEAIARGIAIAGIWAIKGDALNALGREAEARDAYEHVLMFPVDDFLGWASRGSALAGRGRHDEALVAFEQALTLRPESSDMWMAKAKALRALGREAEAQEAEQRAEELEG